MQIKADILGIPLTTMRVTEATCMGAAILTADGLGLLNAREASTAWAVPVRTFMPHEEYTLMYEQRFGLYKEVYDSLGMARRLLRGLSCG